MHNGWGQLDFGNDPANTVKKFLLAFRNIGKRGQG